MQDFDSARVTVMGLGRFGGGAGIARWLANLGARVLLTDLQSEDDLADPLQAIGDLLGTIELRLGGHDERDFQNADLVIANPAVPRPWENRYLLAAESAGVPITTEIRLLTQRINRKRVIGITGTAGKSTTAAMIHHILTAIGQPAHLGGNIGGSLLGSLDRITSEDWIVLELSSFMLHWLGQGVGHADAPGWSPHVAVLTNIEPNHLDWHGTFEHYEQSKRNIFRWQDDGDLALMPGDVPEQEVSLKMPGGHNQLNASVAMRVVELAAGIERAAAGAALANFNGLPHRLSLIAEHAGMRFFDDSKSTTPAATLLAVQAFADPAKVHLIAGGYDKGADLSAISSLASKVAGLYGIGATGGGIVRRASREAASRNVCECVTLDAAVRIAIRYMRPGDVLLLSPGCASWDQFINYEQRGRAFEQAVRKALKSPQDVLDLKSHI